MIKRKAVRIHSRKIDRSVAKNNMKKSGRRQFCKHEKGLRSTFALRWREFV